MKQTSVRPADDIETILNRYGDMLYRISVVLLKNHADSEDAVQETFIKYMLKSPDFSSENHEKAWLITVCTNNCRDILRKRSRTAGDSEEILRNIAVDEESHEILEALFALPDKLRIVMTLHYVEGYKVNEIAKIIGKTSSAVKMRLSKGRTLLRELYGKEYL